MRCSKPYPVDRKRPENAEEILWLRLEEALKEVEEGEDIFLEFLDESSPPTTDNKQRYCSFWKKKMTRNTTRYRTNTFGFISVNGKSALEFKDDSRKESVGAFLGR